jgi:hypothetical protein
VADHAFAVDKLGQRSRLGRRPAFRAHSEPAGNPRQRARLDVKVGVHAVELSDLRTNGDPSVVGQAGRHRLLSPVAGRCSAGMVGGSPKRLNRVGSANSVMRVR